MHHQSGIKILNGLIILTRRMYLIYLITGFVAAVSLLVFVNTVLGPRSDFGRDVVRIFPWFYSFVNWSFLVATIIQIFEIIYICRKFEEREAFLLRERGEQYMDQFRA